MPTLFSMSVTILVSGNGGFARATWPLGTISLDGQNLTLEFPGKRFQIPLDEIDLIRRGLFSISIEHHSAGVPERVVVRGFRLFRRLRTIVEQHHLNIRMSD